MRLAGQDPELLLAPGTVAVPLRSQPNVSPFWIMDSVLCKFRSARIGRIPNALSMSESAGIDSFFGASDAEALFRRLACPSDCRRGDRCLAARGGRTLWN